MTFFEEPAITSFLFAAKSWESGNFRFPGMSSPCPGSDYHKDTFCPRMMQELTWQLTGSSQNKQIGAGNRPFETGLSSSANGGCLFCSGGLTVRAPGGPTR